MWKIVVGFLVVAALTMWLLSKGGDIDMSGEKHGIDTSHAPAAASAAAPASDAAASAPVSASAPASAASN